MNVLDYIAHESERQSATARETLGMYVAWDRARMDFIVGRPLSEERLLLYLRDINGLTGYRNTPVYFRSGGHAVNHALIPQTMERLCEALRDTPPDTFTDVRTGYSVGFPREDVLTKEFLEIHPFADGNGRVGSLLWNRLRGTLLDPEPMPYFFGENNG